MSISKPIMANLQIEKYRYEDEELPEGFFLSNSERTTAWCPLKHRYAYSGGFRMPPDEHKMSPAEFGVGFHYLMEIIFDYWKDNGVCKIPDTLIQSGALDVRSYWSGIYGRGVSNEGVDRLLDIANVWIDHYSLLEGTDATPFPGQDEFEVISTEQTLYMPIVDTSTINVSNPAPLSQLVESFHMSEVDDHYEIANGNDSAAGICDMPMWFIGKLDAILYKRSSNTVWILDHKTTSSPKSLCSKVGKSTQKDSYLMLVQYAIDQGTLNVEKDATVGGFIYNILTSKSMTRPKTIKGGSLSKGKTVNVHSSVYTQEVIDKNLDMSDYDDHIEFLMENIDQKLFIWEEVPYDRKEAERMIFEIGSDASRIAKLYRDAHLSRDVPHLVAATHPRVPVCQIGGFCDFKEICGLGLVNPPPEFNYTISKDKWRIST